MVWGPNVQGSKIKEMRGEGQMERTVQDKMGMSAWRNAKENLLVELYQAVVSLPPLKSPARFRGMVLLILTSVLRDRVQDSELRGHIIRTDDVKTIKLSTGFKDIAKARKFLEGLVRSGHITKRKTDKDYEVFELMFVRPLVQALRFHELKWVDEHGEEDEEG